MLWHCWLDISKNIRLVKVECWSDYVSAARCKWFAYGPAHATATPLSLALLKSRPVLPLWCPCCAGWLVGWSLTSIFSTNTAISETKVVVEKRPLNGCLSRCRSWHQPRETLLGHWLCLLSVSWDFTTFNQCCSWSLSLELSSRLSFWTLFACMILGHSAYYGCIAMMHYRNWHLRYIGCLPHVGPGL